jgi:hypothetical protein
MQGYKMCIRQVFHAAFYIKAARACPQGRQLENQKRYKTVFFPICQSDALSIFYILPLLFLILIFSKKQADE